MSREWAVELKVSSGEAPELASRMCGTRQGGLGTADTREYDSEQAVGMMEARSPRPRPKDGEVLAQGESLQWQLRAVPKGGTEDQEDDSEDGQRCLPGRSLSAA